MTFIEIPSMPLGAVLAKVGMVAICFGVVWTFGIGFKDLLLNYPVIRILVII